MQSSYDGRQRNSWKPAGSNKGLYRNWEVPLFFFSVQVFEDMYLHIVIVANIDFIYNVINLMYNRESLVKSVLSAANWSRLKI